MPHRTLGLDVIGLVALQKPHPTVRLLLGHPAAPHPKARFGAGGREPNDLLYNSMKDSVFKTWFALKLTSFVE